MKNFKLTQVIKRRILVTFIIVCYLSIPIILWKTVDRVNDLRQLITLQEELIILQKKKILFLEKQLTLGEIIYINDNKN